MGLQKSVQWTLEVHSVQAGMTIIAWAKSTTTAKETRFSRPSQQHTKNNVPNYILVLSTNYCPSTNKKCGMNKGATMGG